MIQILSNIFGFVSLAVKFSANMQFLLLLYVYMYFFYNTRHQAVGNNIYSGRWILKTKNRKLFSFTVFPYLDS